MRQVIRAVVTALLLAGFDSPASFAAPRFSADLIVVNGHIVTMDAKDRVAEAIAIRDGRILAVGTNARVRGYARAGTRIVDLQGKTATPGLIDSHAHVADAGLATIAAVQLSDAKDIAEVQRRVAERVATLKPGAWVVGAGWDEGKLAEHRYVLAGDLDGVSPRNPVWLENTTGHYGVANHHALALAGITGTTPDPPAGTIDRDPSGRPSGVLKESARDPIQALIPAPTVTELVDGILASIETMHREGMTGAKDPDIGATQWEAYQALAASGRLKIHVCTLWHTDPSLASVRANIARLSTIPKPPAKAGDNLMSCGVKMFMDGSGVARTAWMYDDWYLEPGKPDTGNHGYPALDPATYREAIRLYTAAGIHVGTHALGDRAIDWTVDSYAMALKEFPSQGLRHSIIHANFPTDHAIETMRLLQQKYDAGFPETQAEFIWWLGDNYAMTLGPARMERFAPLQQYLKYGVRWAGGSDFDVTPLPARFGLWASVARVTLNGTHGRTPFGTTQSVDAKEALRSYTTWAAHQLFLERETGSLEVGKSADMAVWDRDLTKVPSAALRDMRCELTLFRGEIVYQSPQSSIGISTSPPF